MVPEDVGSCLSFDRAEGMRGAKSVEVYKEPWFLRAACEACDEEFLKGLRARFRGFTCL